MLDVPGHAKCAVGFQDAVDLLQRGGIGEPVESLREAWFSKGTCGRGTTRWEVLRAQNGGIHLGGDDGVERGIVRGDGLGGAGQNSDAR